MLIKCPECGKEVSDKAELCPNCGLNIQNFLISEQNIDIVQTIIPSEDNVENEPIVTDSNKKKLLLYVLGGVITVAILISGIAYYNHLKAITPTEINLKIEYGSLEQNSHTDPLEYTIIPATASEAPVTWESSNKKIAVVDDKGCLHTYGNTGTCTITVRANERVFDSMELTVEKSKPDFNRLRDIIDEEHLFTEVSSDGSYLRVDTNPLDVDDFSSPKGMQIIIDANEALDLPESVLQKMTATRALDGQRSETHNDITVTWWYHPDSGLNVIYEIND